MTNYSIDDYFRDNPITDSDERQAEQNKRQMEQDLEDSKKAEQAEALRKAQQKLEPTKEEIARAKSLYKEVLAGVDRGESPTLLLGKCLEAFMFFTGGTTEKLNKVKDKMRVNYGYVERDKDQLALELAEIENRISILESALKNDDVSYLDRKSMETTLNANLKRLKALQKRASTPAEPNLVD